MSIYSIEAYEADGTQLSLNEDRETRDALEADNVWDAVKLLSNVPVEGWLNWEDGEPERVRIAYIRLMHFETRTDSRGRKTGSLNILETIKR